MPRKNNTAVLVDDAIGRKIRSEREISGLTRQKLAAVIGVTHQQLHKYETGKNRVSGGRLKSIATALGKPVQFFFSDDVSLVPSTRGRIYLEMHKEFSKIKDHNVQDCIVMLTRIINRAIIAKD